MHFAKIYIEISNVCNLKCHFCPEVLREKKAMTLDQFTHVIKQAAPLTDRVCLHLMGDPLVHPRFAQILDLCEEHKVSLFLVTNGTLLRKKHFDQLVKPHVFQVNFSLHSFFDNFPNQSPQRYLETIFAFTEKAQEERPDLFINYRLWNLNEVQGMRIENLDLLKRISERFNVDIQPHVDVRKKKSVNVLGRLYLHFDTEFIWPSLDLPLLGTQGRCYGLSSHIGIHADGTVVPCCLDKEAGIPLGNVFEKPLVEILSSERACTVLKGFQQNRLVEDLCQRCQYIERFKRK